MSSLWNIDVDGDKKTLTELIANLHKRDDFHGMMELLGYVWYGNSTESLKTDETAGGQLKIPWDPILLWAQPSLCCLEAIETNMKIKKKACISSVGCGSGLLEWLIQKHSGIRAIGYEVNEEWWTHKHGPPKFIEHIYVDDSVPKLDHDSALFCCYFNNNEIYREYLANYDGDLMIILGPIGRGRSSKPLPLEFTNDPSWRVFDTHEMKNEDLIAFYERV